MRQGDYRFTQYLEQLKLKGAGKPPRVISIPTARDRIALRALAECMLRVYPEASGVIPQVRVFELAGLLQGQHSFDSFIRLDVKEFYPSIGHERVLQVLRRRIRKLELLDIVHQAIRTPTVPNQAPRADISPRGVPQGLAISNVLSEMIAHHVDLRFPRDARYAYFRYVDDILILCMESDVEDLHDRALHSLASNGLEAHPIDGDNGKSRVGRLVDEFDYLGYKFKGLEVSVRKDRVVAIESRLAREFTRYRKGSPGARPSVALRIFVNRVDLAITGCVWNNSARGWLAYYRQLNDLTLLKRLDLTVVSLRKRFNIPGGVRFKTFMRAYWAIRHPHGSDATYIPNHDDLTVNQMREVLADYMARDEVDRMPDRVIPRAFERLINKLTAELERDVGDLS